MAQINLAPGSQYLVIVRRRRRILYFTSALIAVVAIVTGIILTVMVAQAEKTKQTLNAELTSVETRIAQASEEVEKIQLFEKRLTSLENLLKNHKTWTLYLQEIERLLPPDTILTSFEGNHAAGTISLAGSTANIDNAAQTLASLQNQPVSHTTLFTAGTIRNVEHVAQVGTNGELLGQRYNFKMDLTVHIPATN